MAQVGRNVPNTVAKAPITFAMIELAESADCNARKSQWLNYAFKDVTPQFGSQSAVPSLDDSMAAQGRQMFKDMAGVSADWFMLSGHHGAIYSTDYDRFDDASGNVDVRSLVNGEEYCGFFNESYHKLFWEHATRTDPDAKELSDSLQNNNSPYLAKFNRFRDNAIYVRTTDAAPSSVMTQSQDNPFFDTTAWAPAPKGIILSACNTLSYLSVRKAWSGLFPKAVIIGPLDRIISGTWVTNAIAAAAMTTEAFWRDPQSILDQSGQCEELEKQLTANFPSSSKIGLIYKGTLYGGGGSAPAGDPL